MEKSHSNLFTNDTTIGERFENLRLSFENQFDEFFRVEFYSNKIDVWKENLRILIETSNIRLQTFDDEQRKSENFLQRTSSTFRVR